MIGSSSPSQRSRSGKPEPNSRCSSSNQAAPRPRIARPPLIWSSVVAIFATRAGLRIVFAPTMSPIRTRSVVAAQAVIVSHPSKMGPCGSPLRRSSRVFFAVDVGPPLPDRRRPARPHLRGMADDHGLGGHDRARPDWAHGRGEYDPQPGPRGEDGHDARPDQRRPGDPRPPLVSWPSSIESWFMSLNGGQAVGPDGTIYLVSSLSSGSTAASVSALNSSGIMAGWLQTMPTGSRGCCHVLM